MGYRYQKAGENLAEGYRTNEQVIAAWMASPGHRENLLRPEFRNVGITVACGVTDKDTTLIVAEYAN